MILKGFEGFWRILKHFEGFWSILKDFEAIWSILKFFEGFWRILKDFERFWRILKDFEAFCKISWSETSNFPSCKLIIFLFRSGHFPGFWIFFENLDSHLAPGGPASLAGYRIRTLLEPPSWPQLEPLEVKLLLGKKG